MQSCFNFFIKKINRLLSATWITVIVILCGSTSNAISAGFDSNEMKLKMLYLYNFSKLTKWPEEHLSLPHDEFNICIYGDNRYLIAAKVLTNKKIKKHPIKMLSISTPEQVIVCHTLFISRVSLANKKFIKQAFRHNVLTVSDEDDFIDNGGIIQLININNKIRFEINVTQMKEGKLEISSKLLRLAKTIHRKKVMD